MILQKCIYALISDHEESHDNNPDDWHDNLCKSHDFYTRNYSIYTEILQSICARVYQT